MDFETHNGLPRILLKYHFIFFAFFAAFSLWTALISHFISMMQNKLPTDIPTICTLLGQCSN